MDPLTAREELLPILLCRAKFQLVSRKRSVASRPGPIDFRAMNSARRFFGSQARKLLRLYPAYRKSYRTSFLCALLALSPLVSAHAAGSIGIALTEAPSSRADDPRARIYIVDQLFAKVEVIRRLSEKEGQALAAQAAPRA